MLEKRRLFAWLGAICLLLLLAAPVLAHVPVTGGDNDTPATATVVDNPTKSWALYDRLDADGVAYVRATFEAGDRLYAATYTPDRELQPAIVVMSPRIDGQPALPDSVTVPDGYGAILVQGPTGEPELEPFTPGAYFFTAEIDRQVPAGGEYLLAVYDERGRAGPVGLALGRNEQFTPIEYLTVPIDVLAVHAWEGDSPAVVFGPAALIVVLGLVWLRPRIARRDERLRRWALGLSAIGMGATSASLAVQLGISLAMAGVSPIALLPTLLIAVPAALAVWLARLATLPRLALSWRRRVGVGLAGAVGLLTWAGLLVAPLLAILVALVPDRG